MRLGLGITTGGEGPGPGSQTPLALASQALVAQAVSRNRFTLGIGLSHQRASARKAALHNRCATFNGNYCMLG
jgi:alkanesulfonate monooxygenase SsuD/methylene tetrahydromethanopterin reductase-like flavin-dependent oxidoreductase (luciferase family)